MKVLIVDDESPIREFLKKGITKLTGFSAEVAQDGGDALRKIEGDLYDLVLTDMKMPVLDGIDLLKAIKKREPETRVIVMTGYGTIKAAVEAMKNGADDFITKPIDLDELFLRLSKVEKEMFLVRENRLLRQEARRRSAFDSMIGKSKRMQEVFSLIERVAPSASTVLICGGSGTGKELVARAIHDHSVRAEKPFIPFNCGTIPESLIESELFGHKKGAFTGAVQAKRGLFEEADGGTFFLDEISTLPLPVQVKLLRALEEREVMRLGDTQRVKVDLRILAATNEDLQANVKKGTFREDLFYRLYVFPIFLPDLVDRREDIPLLAYHFLKVYAEENKKRIKGVSPEAMKMLLEQEWPGNVRELENAICRAVLMTDKEYLVPDDFPQRSPTRSSNFIRRGIEERRSLDEIKAEYIRETLKEAEGNAKLAAEILKVHPKTIYRLNKELLSKDN